MSKAIRLQQLSQEIRLHTPPVTAEILAAAMAVSARTIYRDIQTLRSSGVVIEGAAGYGFTLTEDPAMPPQRVLPPVGVSTLSLSCMWMRR